MAEPTSTLTPTAADRTLTDLPVDVIIHILSFLPTFLAVQTSLISRQFRSLWSRVPALHFSYDHFPSAVPDPAPGSDPTRLFANSVDRALLLRSPSPIQTFRLSFIYHRRHTSRLDSWLRSAVTRLHARELHLDLYINRHYHNNHDDDDDDRMYDFPLAVLRSSRVEVLSLTRCDLRLPKDMSALNLVAIRTAYLDQIELTDEMVRDFILGCPNLTDLEIQNCYGHEDLKIRSEKLKRLTLGYFYDMDERNTVEIDCCNLLFLEFDCCDFSQFSLKNAASLVEFHLAIVHMDKYFHLWSKVVKLLEKAPNVKHLNVENWWLKFMISKDCFPENFKLQNVRLLELRTEYTQYDLIGMVALLQLCPNLETMVLDHLHKLDDDPRLPAEILNCPLPLNIPSLKHVKLLTYAGTEDEQNFVTMLKRQGAALQKITLFPIKTDEDSCQELPPIVLRRKPRDCEAT
ncbi:F-box/LRR-repeat protein At3g26922-like [Argentina anserina]|uniref:F-box/LRR-repeat protein At3g26922-like n=1 Tax=Argentina anserina TaxID=57926 RepID=UPI00217683C1|nr:F-box/LRR-repeat protein At3g26922-like [Potentilla anserina]